MLHIVGCARFIAALAAAAVSAASTPPPAPSVPYTQTFYGTGRSDPYHWMEAGGPQLDAYVRRQSEYAKALLRTNPGRPALLAALKRAYAASSTSSTPAAVARAGSRIYYLQNLPGATEPSLLARSAGRARPIVIVDAKKLPPGRDIEWYEISPKMTKIAYGVAAPSEDVVVHVCNADGSGDAAQAIAPDVIPDVTWRDERSFYYHRARQMATTRDDQGDLHAVGAPAGSDVPIAGYGARGPAGSTTVHATYSTFAVLGTEAVIASEFAGVDTHESTYAAPFAAANTARGPWRRIFGESDLVVASVAAGRFVYGLSDRGNARRVILVRDLRTGAPIRTIVPAGDAFRESIFANRTGLFVVDRSNVGVTLERFDPSGRSRGNVALPKADAIIAINGDAERSAFVVATARFSDLGHFFEIAGAAAAVRDLGISPAPPAITAQIHTDDEVATSADGTKVPYTVLSKAGMPRDGRRPALLWGYGAYGLNFDPPVPPFVAALVDLGVVVVIAHARGGGEFGEPWHLAGKGPQKQHTIDDFVACAHALVTEGWTSPSKLAGLGGSAGGITIGGAITQHPGLFAVAISQAGMSDMVDFENAPNGVGNVQEFGSVKTSSGFHDLLAMSAYDHAAPAAYPATFLTTGLTDVRVPPWEVAKFAARLQAATTSGKPVLLRADSQGHGVVYDTSLQIQEDADTYTFMLWQLGEPGFSPP